MDFIVCVALPLAGCLAFVLAFRKGFLCLHEWYVYAGLPKRDITARLMLAPPGARAWQCCKCGKIAVKPYDWLPINFN